MAADLPIVDIRTRRQWRGWLEKHHDSSQGIWFTFHKKHSGVTSLPYEDFVGEALCFGWIDSLVKRLDEDRYAIKVTPRRPTSKWSAINRKRWQALKKDGLLSAAGEASPPTERVYAPKPKIPNLPTYFAKAVKANAKAWKFFTTLPDRERRNFVVWVHTAKKLETRERRLAESIRVLASGQRLGLK